MYQLLGDVLYLLLALLFYLAATEVQLSALIDSCDLVYLIMS